MRILLLVSLAAGALAPAVQFPEAEIEAALAAGAAQELAGSIEVGSTDRGRFSVRLAGPLGRVTLAAAEARREGEPFGRELVTPAMLGPTVQVIVQPNDPDFRIERTVTTPPAEGVVLEVRGGRTARTTIEPLRAETVPLRWSNARGAIVNGQGIRADFDREALPASDFEVVVRTARGEQRYRVRAADLARLR